MNENWFLPDEFMDAAGVPSQYRYQVAYKTLCAKYCALVEALMQITGGEPVEFDLRRAQDIAGQNPRTTDPTEIVMVVEEPVDVEASREDGRYQVRLATVEEVRKANHRYALQNMGARRN